MTDMAQVFATSLKEKSAEDQARFEAMMEKMQNRIDQQDANMKAVLDHLVGAIISPKALCRPRTPRTWTSSSTLPWPARMASPTIRLPSPNYVPINMEATSKLTAQTDYRKWLNSAAGKQEFKTAVTVKGITDDVDVAAHMSQVRSRFNTDAATGRAQGASVRSSIPTRLLPPLPTMRMAIMLARKSLGTWITCSIASTTGGALTPIPARSWSRPSRLLIGNFAFNRSSAMTIEVPHA